MKKLVLFFILLVVVILFFWKEKKAPSHLTTEKNFIQSERLSVETKLNTKNDPEDQDRELSNYQHELDRAFKTLPTIDDLQNLTQEEVHHTPELINDGAEVIGRIHDAGELEPRKRTIVMSFFKKCAEDQELATSLRAVCLSKIYKLVPEWQIPMPIASDISPEVEELAVKLP